MAAGVRRPSSRARPRPCEPAEETARPRPCEPAEETDDYGCRGLRWEGRGGRYYFYVVAGGAKICFQTTVRRCGGSSAEAKRLCRLCFDKFKSGATREEVAAYRDILYAQYPVLPRAERAASARTAPKDAASAKEAAKRITRATQTEPVVVLPARGQSGAALVAPSADSGAVQPANSRPSPWPVKRKARVKRTAPGEVPSRQVARRAEGAVDPNVDEEYAEEMRAWEQAGQNAAGMDQADRLCTEESTALCRVVEALPLRRVSCSTDARSLTDGTHLMDDVVMPIVGFGTYKLKGEGCFRAVLRALEVGYRLIDTAQVYENEHEVCRALRQSGIPRERVCLETKHWRSWHGYERTLKACRSSLRRLGTDYIDLYLIHWPGCKTGFPLPRGAVSPPDWTPEMRDEGTWRAMEKLYEEGMVKALGVSNYSIRHLQTLLSTCTVRPTVNQVEFHPWLVQSELLEFCRSEGIVLQAYASLGSGDVSSRADFFALKPVRAAAQRHDRSSAQVLLRWAIEKGVHVIPKSKSAERMVENFGVFDFTLSAAEVAAIDACHKGHRFAWKKVDPDTVL